jgi:uncharacterized protein (DUF952 family)
VGRVRGRLPVRRVTVRPRVRVHPLLLAQAVGGTALGVFPTEPALVIAAIDAGALGETVRWEQSSEGGVFGHVYRQVPRHAGTAVYEA